MAEDNPLPGYEIPRGDDPQGASPLSSAGRPRRSLRLAIAGGGTGGHVVPGLHLLDSLQEVIGQVGVAAPRLEDLLWFHSGRRAEERCLKELDRQAAEIGVDLERVVLPIEPEGGGAPSLVRLSQRRLKC